MTQFQPTGFKVLPTVVKNLLIINGLFFLATISFGDVFNVDLTKILGLHYLTASDFKPYQFVTYMFMHGGFAHILFNMFALWMFGNTLENVWGPRRFLIYYMVTGIGAGMVYLIWISFQISPVINEINTFLETRDLVALGQFTSEHTFRLNEFSGAIWQQFQGFEQSLRILSANPENTQAMQTAISFMTDYKEFYLNQHVVVGASGAVFGILLAFGMMFPNAVIYLYFAIPIKAKYFVIIYGAFELFEGVMNRPGSNIAHFAHLGGMLFGYLLIMYWKKKGEFR
ncbi:MAG: rhomboid family intramembrane serine protease [Bacteroidales bacterium]|nr:rhomboid family intramembrane serine protease [Bacteroidales bacterium]